MAAVVKTTSQRIYVTNELTPSFAPQNAKTITHRAMKQYQNRKVNLKFPKLQLTPTKAPWIYDRYELENRYTF